MWRLASRMTGQDRANHEKEEWGTVKNKKQTKAMGTDDPPGLVLCDDFKISDNLWLLLPGLYMLDRKRRRLRKRRKRSRTAWLPDHVTAISILCIFVWSWPESDLATLQERLEKEAEKHRKEAERRGPNWDLRPLEIWNSRRSSFLNLRKAAKEAERGGPRSYSDFFSFFLFVWAILN